MTSLASPLTDARPAERLAELAAHLRPLLGDKTVIEDPAPRYVGDTAVQAPDGTAFLLVLPADTAGVQEVLRLAHETRTPVVPRGAGSGLSGGAAPSTGAIDPADGISVCFRKALRAEP